MIVRSHKKDLDIYIEVIGHWKYQRWDLADLWRRVWFLPFGLLKEHFFLLFFRVLRLLVKISIDLSNPAITVPSSVSLSSSSRCIKMELLLRWSCLDTFRLSRPRCQSRPGISSCSPTRLTWSSLSSISWVGHQVRAESEDVCSWPFPCQCWSFVWFSLQKQI